MANTISGISPQADKPGWLPNCILRDCKSLICLPVTSLVSEPCKNRLYVMFLVSMPEMLYSHVISSQISFIHFGAVNYVQNWLRWCKLIFEFTEIGDEFEKVKYSNCWQYGFSLEWLHSFSFQYLDPPHSQLSGQWTWLVSPPLWD